MLVVSLLGCAAQSDPEAAASSASALEERWSGSTPMIFAIERPFDMSFDDWSDLEVNDPLHPEGAWRPARTVERPEVSARPSEGSSLVRELQHGFGSGPCRPRINPFERSVGFMCKWTF